MKQKTYLDKLMENKEFKEKFEEEYKRLDMDREHFIAMILRIITLSIEDKKELEDIIKDIERVIETHRMINN